MIGITAFGAYIPRLRLSRQSALAALSRPSPDIPQNLDGERAVCNFDEDTLTMAHEAARACLRTDRAAVDALYLCSTTHPYADRLNAGLLKTALGIREELQTADLTGSLRVGTTGLIHAFNAVKAGTARNVLVAAADRRLAPPGSADELLQGDGAAAMLVGEENPLAELLGGVSITRDTLDHYRRADKQHDYHWEERWAIEAVYLPALTQALDALLKSTSLSIDTIDRFVLPAPSTTVHRRLVRKLRLPPDRTAPPMLDRVGDTGAAHPLLILARELETAPEGAHIACFGLGSGADALCFRVTNNRPCRTLPTQVTRSIDYRVSLEPYAKFLTFRGELAPTFGVRGEFQTKTALSVLLREQAAILGLVGGKCTACGTPQYPKARLCVNPVCRKSDTQAPYSFAEQIARARTYTADNLLPSPNPPSIYGLLQFDNGGRMHAEFTDCVLEELQDGMKMRMVFRKRYEDDERGFVGYFWKAAPARNFGSAS